MAHHLADNRCNNVGDTAAPAAMGGTNGLMLFIAEQDGLTVGLLNHQTGARIIRNQSIAAAYFNIVRIIVVVDIDPAVVHLNAADQPLDAHFLLDVAPVLLNIIGAVPGPEADVETFERTAADTAMPGEKSIGNHGLRMLAAGRLTEQRMCA